MSFKFGFALLLTLTALTLSAHSEAQDVNAEMANRLKGTIWQGRINVPELQNIEGAIRIAFLPELTPQGDLRYFHKMVSPQWILKAISKVDVACPVTPRTMKIQPKADGGLQGYITMFDCTNTETEEVTLESDPRRKAKSHVRVTDFKLSPDGNSLYLQAIILGFKVRYRMTRVEFINPTDQSLRAWIDGVK